MFKITKIKPWLVNGNEIKRYYIDFENGNKIWVHPTILKRRNLIEGMYVDIEKLSIENEGIENEFKWKHAYNNGSWEREKIRINIVKDYIQSLRNDLDIHTVGFGADSTEIIYQHPEEQGSPDLDVLINNQQVAKIEVTGSEFKRGTDYWIRPDKIKYIQEHPNENIWIILHYQNPSEMIFIKIDIQKKYIARKINIRGNEEQYVIFNPESAELKSQKEFIDEVQSW